MKKKLGAFLLCAVMALSLVGCGSGNDTASKGTTQTDTQTEDSSDITTEAAADEGSADNTDSAAGFDSKVSENPASDEEQAEENTADPAGEESGKTLVVYFSATGNTKTAAEFIADETGADIFEITPAQSYTSDDLNYNNDDSRVSKEHNDESLRDVELTTTEVPGWESYDTVFIGYPIWWGTSAWPVDSFVKANDFAGKTVYPFCTSASSGLGDSASNLAEKAGTGDWKDGQRFSSGVTEDEVADWISGL